MLRLTKPQRALGWLLTVAVVASALAFGAFVWRNRPIPVRVAVVEDNVPVRVFGLGTIEARVLSRVSFEVGATLAEVRADHGDVVRKGDVLARLSLGEQEARVAKARAALVSAEVGIRKAQANHEKSRAVLAQKQEANRRKQALVGRNVVTEQSAEESQRDEDVAKADVNVALSEIEVASSFTADARAQLTFEETMLGHRTLVAPYDALVVERHKEVGAVIKTGDPVFTLIATGSYWGLAYVDEARAGFIVEGQKVEARMRSRPLDSFTGQVVRIGLESDRVSEERRVYIKGDNPPSRVYLGEQAEFWITVARLDRALLVSEAAVHGFDGRQGMVWTVEDGRLRRRAVAFRHRTEDSRLEIVDGLPAGAQVVTQLTPDLRDGRLARPEPVSPGRQSNAAP